MAKTDKSNALEQSKKYYKKGTDYYNTVIKEELEKDSGEEIVTGGQAVNKQLPKWLNRETDDWDVFMEGDPKKNAQKMEKLLDKRYGGNYFRVVALPFPHHYRVESIVTGNEVMDITLMDKGIPHKKIDGINYVTLDYQVDMMKKSLLSPSKKYRWPKDRDTLRRILIYKKEMGENVSKALVDLADEGYTMKNEDNGISFPEVKSDNEIAKKDIKEIFETHDVNHVFGNIGDKLKVILKKSG